MTDINTEISARGLHKIPIIKDIDKQSHRKILSNRNPDHNTTPEITPLSRSNPARIRESGGVKRLTTMQDQETGKTLVMGRLHPESITQEGFRNDPYLQEKILEQAQVSQTIGEHPHIITQNVLAVSRPDSPSRNDVIYIGSEYFKSTDALKWITSTNPSLEQVASVFDQIALAIQHMHDKGYLHLDIKPGNILIGEDSDHNPLAKLNDFDTVHKIGNRQVPESNLGSEEFAPPEQYGADENGNFAVDQRSDLYAFAKTVNKLLVRSGIKSKLDGKTQSELTLLTQKASAPNPADRHASIAEFNQQLQDLLAKASNSHTRETQETPSLQDDIATSTLADTTTKIDR